MARPNSSPIARVFGARGSLVRLRSLLESGASLEEIKSNIDNSNVGNLILLNRDLINIDNEIRCIFLHPQHQEILDLLESKKIPFNKEAVLIEAIQNKQYDFIFNNLAREGYALQPYLEKYFELCEHLNVADMANLANAIEDSQIDPRQKIEILRLINFTNIFVEDEIFGQSVATVLQAVIEYTKNGRDQDDDSEPQKEEDSEFDFVKDKLHSLQINGFTDCARFGISEQKVFSLLAEIATSFFLNPQPDSRGAAAADSRSSESDSFEMLDDFLDFLDEIEREFGLAGVKRVMATNNVSQEMPIFIFAKNYPHEFLGFLAQKVQMATEAENLSSSEILQMLKLQDAHGRYLIEALFTGQEQDFNPRIFLEFYREVLKVKLSPQDKKSLFFEGNSRNGLLALIASKASHSFTSFFKNEICKDLIDQDVVSEKEVFEYLTKYEFGRDELFGYSYGVFMNLIHGNLAEFYNFHALLKERFLPQYLRDFWLSSSAKINFALALCNVDCGNFANFYRNEIKPIFSVCNEAQRNTQNPLGHRNIPAWHILAQKDLEGFTVLGLIFKSRAEEFINFFETEVAPFCLDRQKGEILRDVLFREVGDKYPYEIKDLASKNPAEFVRFFQRHVKPVFGEGDIKAIISLKSNDESIPALIARVNPECFHEFFSEDVKNKLSREELKDLYLQANSSHYPQAQPILVYLHNNEQALRIAFRDLVNLSRENILRFDEIFNPQNNSADNLKRILILNSDLPEARELRREFMRQYAEDRARPRGEWPANAVFGGGASVVQLESSQLQRRH